MLCNNAPFLTVLTISPLYNNDEANVHGINDDRRFIQEVQKGKGGKEMQERVWNSRICTLKHSKKIHRFCRRRANLDWFSCSHPGSHLLFALNALALLFLLTRKVIVLLRREISTNQSVSTQNLDQPKPAANMSDRLRKKKRRASSSRRPRQETKLPQEEGAADKVAENKAAENKHVTPASITLTRYIWEHVPELASLMSFDAFTSAVLASRAIVHDDTLTARLGPDIMTSILIDFLDVDTRTKLRSCARALHQRIPASIRFELKDQHWGDFGGADHVIDYIRLPQCLSSLVARVEWKDQGWGNRKGQLFLTLERNGNDVARQDVFGIAEHTWSTAEAILDTKSAVVFRSRAGDTLKICTHVGGGGGHRLEVKSLSITAGCSTSAEADRRNRHDRAREAKLAPYLAWTAAVQDDQFSASSAWDQRCRTHACHFCRLESLQPARGHSSAWCAGFNDDRQWIQVDLREPHVVTAIATQGRRDCAQWVSEYTLSTSLDGKVFIPLRDDPIFVGNEDQTSVVVHQLERYAAYGRYLRLHPRAWHGHISMRWA
eukprot:g16776.t1